jgi:hypothetical protein
MTAYLMTVFCMQHTSSKLSRLRICQKYLDVLKRYTQIRCVFIANPFERFDIYMAHYASIINVLQLVTRSFYKDGNT